MLLNLQPLDVDVGQHHTHHENDAQNAHGELYFQTATKGVSGRHETTHGADEGQDQNGVAVESMDQQGLVPDGRDELKADEKTGGEDGGEVHSKAHLGDAPGRPITLADARVPAHVAVMIEVLEPGEDEAHHGSSKDKKENKIVAFREPDRVVELPSHCDEGIGRWAV